MAPPAAPPTTSFRPAGALSPLDSTDPYTSAPWSAEMYTMPPPRVMLALLMAPTLPGPPIFRGRP